MNNILIVLLAFLCVLIVLGLPLISAIKQAIKDDEKDYAIGSKYRTINIKTYAHLKKTILYASVAIVIFTSILSWEVYDAKQRDEEKTHFYTAIRNSDCFSSVDYDEGHLYLTFRESGSTYMYADVPWKVYQEFYHSDNLGAYYNNNIKGQYPSIRID